MKKLLFILLTVVLLFSSTFIGSVFANRAPGEVGLTIRPAIIDLAAEKGTTVTSTVLVQNISEGPVGVTIGAQSLIPNDALVDQEKRKDTDASTWMINKGKKILLEVDEVKEVEVQFLVPPEASPGGHYALVTFTTSTSSTQTSTGSKVTPVLSSLAFITVAGDIIESAKIGNLDMPFFIFGETQTLKFDIINDGNIHILPTATVKLYDRGDKLIENISVPAQLILPGTIKNFITQWQSKNHVGFHRLEIDVTFGTPSQTVSLGSQTVFILPDLISLAFGLSLIIIVALALLFLFKNPLKKLRRKLKSLSYKFRVKKVKEPKSANKPEDIASISMSQRKLDDLLSSGGNAKSASKKPPRKIDIN